MSEMIKNLSFTADGLLTFLRNRSGATAIEYALVAGGISVAIVVTVQTTGSELVGIYTLVADSFPQ